MSDLFGATRSIITPHYALLTPAGLVSSVVPGWHDAQCYIVIAPAMGARFSQMLVTLGPSGGVHRTSSEHEYLVFVRSGAVLARIGDNEQRLETGGYCYIPPGHVYSISAAAETTQLVLFQRSYVPLASIRPPDPLFGNEVELSGSPFLGDEAALLKTLLPDTPAFDMAVNIFTFQPGATLPFVETHVMEHGLLMLQGQGIYRLANDWHPVQAGDVIWMAPYCPQWFVATGKTPARYLYYKDVNRDPLV